MLLELVISIDISGFTLLASKKINRWNDPKSISLWLYILCRLAINSQRTNASEIRWLAKGVQGDTRIRQIRAAPLGDYSLMFLCSADVGYKIGRGVHLMLMSHDIKAHWSHSVLSVICLERWLRVKMHTDRQRDVNHIHYIILTPHRR